MLCTAKYAFARPTSCDVERGGSREMDEKTRPIAIADGTPNPSGTAWATLDGDDFNRVIDV